eukprot:7047651-Prymnesium_polylepis.1
MSGVKVDRAISKHTVSHCPLSHALLSYLGGRRRRYHIISKAALRADATYTHVNQLRSAIPTAAACEDERLLDVVS